MTRGSDAESVSTSGGSRGEGSDSAPVRALGSIGFTEAARRVSDALRARGYTTAVSFRAPPQNPRLDRSLTRHEGGTIMVAVRVRGRDRDDVLRDLCTGAVVAVLGTVDEALVEELLVAADPPEPKPEPFDYSKAMEEPF